MSSLVSIDLLGDYSPSVAVRTCICIIHTQVLCTSCMYVHTYVCHTCMRVRICTYVGCKKYNHHSFLSRLHMLQELEEHITTFLGTRKQPQGKHILERWEARFALAQVHMYIHMYIRAQYRWSQYTYSHTYACTFCCSALEGWSNRRTNQCWHHICRWI